MRELFKSGSLAKPTEPSLSFCLYLALQTTAFLKTTSFSPYWEVCPMSPCVREEPQTFQHPYFVHLVAQPRLGSLGRVKPFWERIRASDCIQSKQAAPAKPRISRRFQVYCG